MIATETITTQTAICTCGHAETEHFKYGVPLTRGRCKMDGKDDHYCLQFESVEAAAQRQREQEERRERMAEIVQLLAPNLGYAVVDASILFQYNGHRFVIREVE